MSLLSAFVLNGRDNHETKNPQKSLEKKQKPKFKRCSTLS